MIYVKYETEYGENTLIPSGAFFFTHCCLFKSLLAVFCKKNCRYGEKIGQVEATRGYLSNGLYKVKNSRVLGFFFVVVVVRLVFPKDSHKIDFY